MPAAPVGRADGGSADQLGPGEIAMRMLVTGGAGFIVFIGSAVVRQAICAMDDDVFGLDKLTYAGNRSSLAADRRQSALQY